MWIWLIVSVILVIASIVFGIHSFFSSRTFQRSISEGSEYRLKDIQLPRFENRVPVSQTQNFSDLISKVKSMEEGSLRNVYQLNKLQERIVTLEGKSLEANEEGTKWDDDSEDWEKMYYETRRERESVAIDLRSVNDALQQTLLRVQELENQQATITQMKSNDDTRLNELLSLQNVIEQLQRKIEGAAQREKELEQQLQQEKHLRSENEFLQDRNFQLNSETDELTNRFKEIKEQNIVLEKKIRKLSELESSLQISEHEKSEIKNSLKQIVSENKTLSQKLQELQHSLVEERI